MFTKQQYERKFFPERTRRREMDKIKADPHLYGKWLADQSIKRLRELLQLR